MKQRELSRGNMVEFERTPLEQWLCKGLNINQCIAMHGPFLLAISFLLDTHRLKHQQIKSSFFWRHSWTISSARMKPYLYKTKNPMLQNRPPLLWFHINPFLEEQLKSNSNVQVHQKEASIFCAWQNGEVSLPLTCTNLTLRMWQKLTGLINI